MFFSDVVVLILMFELQVAKILLEEFVNVTFIFTILYVKSYKITFH